MDGRDIQQPLRRLQKAHETIGRLLGRIEAPSYLQSGLKGTSYRKNAEQHLPNGSARMFTMDIQKFFPSASYKYIWKAFIKAFHCDGDVASILTRICVVHGHLPTGSSLSTILSFHAYKPMFARINEVCAERDVVFTCYVDDLTCSGERADRKLAAQLRRIIRHFGLTPHPKKTKFYKRNQTKVVTGVAITSRGLRLPNSRRRASHEDCLKLAGEILAEERLQLENRLTGRLGEAAMFENRFRKHSDAFQNRRKNRRSPV